MAAAPVCYFTFTSNGLSINFMDRSSGSNLTYLWDFGFKVEGQQITSNQKNPEIEFPAEGTYLVALKIANADGFSIKHLDIVVSLQPNMFISIYEMVIDELPKSFVLDLISFKKYLNKWQFFFQDAAQIATTDLFNESKWPPLYTVLIAKLINLDLILRTINSGILSAASLTTNSLNPSLDIIEVGDYSADFHADEIFDSGTLTLANLTIDGITYARSQPFGNLDDFLGYLNLLEKGHFIYNSESRKLVTNANSHKLSIFNYTSSNLGGINSAFSEANLHLTSLSGYVKTIESTTSTKGGLKRIETGPANAEWFDISDFWKNMLSKNSSALTAIKEDICMIANKLTVRLSICKELKTASNIQIFKKGQ